MRKIISLVRLYFTEHFRPVYFAAVVVFTALLIWINYHYDLETRYISYEISDGKRLLEYCLMYFIALGGGYALYVFSPKDRSILANRNLWLLIVLSVFLFSFRTWFYQYNAWTQEHVAAPYRHLANKYFTNLQGFVWLFFPCAVYWFLKDRQQPLYGFHRKGVVLWPYFVLLLLMVPLIIWASTQPDFLQTYPRAFHLNLDREGTRNFLLTLLYEVCYGLDFVTTEFFFRGFLILAFARFAGPRVILPMCVFYVTIHFEKPLGETISSFFGGWLLGILAYETKSIYGGIIVHLGIAMLMEIVAWIAQIH